MTTAGEPDRTESTEAKPKSKRSRAAVATAVVIGLVVLFVVGGGLLRRRRDSTTDASTSVERLPTEPKERFTTTLDVPISQVADTVGSPDRLAVTYATEEDYQLRVIDGEGTELWRRDIDSEATVKMVGDDVIIGVPSVDDDHGQLMLLDGDDGTELWSESVLPFDLLDIFDDTALMLRFSIPNDTLAAYDWHSGDKIAERSFAGVDLGRLESLRTNGGFITVEDGELSVVNERLEEISTPIAIADLDGPGAYTDGELVFAGDRQLTRYGSDGEKIASAEFEVADIFGLEGVGNSTWFFWADETCGAFTFSDDEPKLLWQTEDCEIEVQRTIARFQNGPPLMLRNGDEPVVIDVMTGKRVHSGDDGGFVAPFANGFVDWSERDRTAYSWPGGEEMFSVPIEESQYFRVLDGGYLILDEAGDGIDLTVYD